MPDDDYRSDGGDDESLVVLVPAWLVRAVYVATAVALVLLLALHTGKWHRIRVDTTSVLLLALLILLPLAPYLTKFKAGGVEAEFGRRVRRLRETAESVPEPEAVPPPVEEAGDDIMSLVRRDPTLGLAKLRIDLEEVVRRRYLRLIEPDNAEWARRVASASQMVRALDERGLIDRALVPSLREVLALCNRAIHGVQVGRSDAEEVAEVGIRLLEILKAEEELADGDAA
jgi:hypothetical protein